MEPPHLASLALALGLDANHHTQQASPNTAKGISIILGAAWLSHNLRGHAKAPITEAGKHIDAIALVAFQYAYASLTIAGGMGWSLEWFFYMLFFLFIGRGAVLVLSDFESRSFQSVFARKPALTNWFGLAMFAFAISFLLEVRPNPSMESQALVILFVLGGMLMHANIRLLAWRSRWVLICLGSLIALNYAVLLLERHT